MWRTRAALAAGSLLALTVFDAGGKIAGMTTCMNVDTPNRRVEIGSTWHAKCGQRSAAFFNQQGRRGIERLGAKQDGILRNRQIAPNGTLRDAVVYSIIASEWPTVKAHLEYQLNEKTR